MLNRLKYRPHPSKRKSKKRKNPALSIPPEQLAKIQEQNEDLDGIINLATDILTEYAPRIAGKRNQGKNKNAKPRD